MWRINNNTRRGFKNGGHFMSFGYQFEDVVGINDDELLEIPEGPLAD